ncbi:uncharacterized protein LOC119731198 [Patiria miniata]|uniref:Calcium signal-modulating cyclophilin ligand n=1 Tax=Patiria miniata TaxID=46514 RepID=A0A914A9W4_PATMI|nr:uncharacterized protein LOC119731198 [Patiria miniata]
MADISARRESRRQKLLQSSEERFQKIKQLNEKQQGSIVEAKEDAEMSAATTPLVSIDQAQSENAHEGENAISTLPLEDSQAERSCQIDCERTKESVDQSIDAQGVHSSSLEHIGRSNMVHEEAEANPHGDVECLQSSDTAAQQVVESNPTHPQRSDQVAATPASPNNSSAISCSFPVHSSHPTHRNQIQNSSIQNTSPPIPSSEHKPVSTADTGTSLTEQPQPQLAAQDVQDLSSTPQTGQVWMLRELVVVLVAILMRGLLVVHWFKSVGGQSVIIPFIALEVLFFSIRPQTLQPSSGVMVKVLSFAAMMCSIPQAVIKKFQLTLSIINTFCEDLALYLFVFILTHAMVEILS